MYRTGCRLVFTARSCRPHSLHQNKLFYGWWIVLAAAFGIMLGVTSLPQVSMGAMMPALEAEYGWSRTELSSVLAVFLILGIVMAPVSGAIADRFGPRILIAASSIMMAAIFLVLAKQQPTLGSLRLSYGLIAVLGAGTNTIVFSRLIANWFYTKRGMALGLALVGGGLTTMLVPYLITLAISANGWRTAYLLLSGLTLVIAPLALLVVRNDPLQWVLLWTAKPAEVWQLANHRPKRPVFRSTKPSGHAYSGRWRSPR